MWLDVASICIMYSDRLVDSHAMCGGFVIRRGKGRHRSLLPDGSQSAAGLWLYCGGHNIHQEVLPGGDHESPGTDGARACTRD